MEVFKVAPFDQNLMVNGVYLTDNHLTLGQLKVLPGSLIFLRVRKYMFIQGKTISSSHFRLMSPPTLPPVQVKTMSATWRKLASKEQGC